MLKYSVNLIPVSHLSMTLRVAHAAQKKLLSAAFSILIQRRISINILLLFFASSCTQQPAQIVMKGQQSYSRGSQSSYNKSSYSSSSRGSSSGSSYGANSSYENQPILENTEETVSVSSIGITDLAPPSTSVKPQINSEPYSSPASKTLTTPSDAPVPVSGTGFKRNNTVKTLNPWTNKPRSDNAPQTKTKTTKMEAKSAPKLVNIYANKKENKTNKKEEAIETEHRITVARERDISGLKWPVSGRKILSSFGAKGGGKANDGINIAAAKGDPVWAAADGEVVYVSNDLKDYGNMVLIKHVGRKATSYAHLSRATVDKYQKVKRGQIIGYVGSTGSVKTPQLFFSLHNGKQAINPHKYMSSEVAGL